MEFKSSQWSYRIWLEKRINHSFHECQPSQFTLQHRIACVPLLICCSLCSITPFTNALCFYLFKDLMNAHSSFLSRWSSFTMVTHLYCLLILCIYPLDVAAGYRIKTCYVERCLCSTEAKTNNKLAAVMFRIYNGSLFDWLRTRLGVDSFRKWSVVLSMHLSVCLLKCCMCGVKIIKNRKGRTRTRLD